ncbi:MAG TPA: protein kinase [Kofleriaceae bacterium]
MGGQPAEQIIAGVVLSERLAVTMYGAIHRAQFSGQRNLRGLVVDGKMLAELSFRGAVTDSGAVSAAIALDHANIVPTVAVEAGGSDVVVVSRGGGRYVTVQDLIAAARANRKEGGKLSLPVAAAIGKSVVEALAASHRARVVHGAVHPRSVLVDEDGHVQVGDFVVGRALTMAVAQGADSSLWRGLAGYLAPELVVGEEPSPACDVFAVGAMLFTMLSGEVPPGTLHVTPAVERLVQRALDTDLTRRYKNANDLLENLLEAFEDDRWEIADRASIIKAAGLSRADTNIDEATEDLLASLGSINPGAVQVTPIRPSMDIRAEAVAARQLKTPKTGPGTHGRLDALLADLDDSKEHTAVDDKFIDKDPISELIHMDPRKREAIVQVRPRTQRVPSLDDPDEDDVPPAPLPADHPRSNTRDESAAMSALAELDDPVRRVSGAAEVASAAAEKLERAARRAEQAADRVENASTERSSSGLSRPIAKPQLQPQPELKPAQRPVVPIVDPIDVDAPPPRIRSRMFGIVTLLLLVAAGVGFYFIYTGNLEAKTKTEREAAARKKRDEDEKKKLSDNVMAAQADLGALEITSTPAEAGVWLRLGRTPVDSMMLPANSTHELAILLDGYALAEAQVMAASWTGEGQARRAVVTVPLQKLVPDKKQPPVPAVLPLQPTALHATTTAAGDGPIHVESTPADAEVYLFVGVTGSMRFSNLIAGRDYEAVVVKPGFKSRFVSIKADEWRDGGDPKIPIDVAKKKALITKAVELEPEKPEKKR